MTHKESREKDRGKQKITNVCAHLYCTGVTIVANNTAHASVFLTLSDEQAVTLEAAMMKSRINMVAPGRPMLKNLGLQCFMMVFTMSCRKHVYF